jgi:hypothetical protein
MGKIKKEKGQSGYSKKTFNEFMMQHYVIENPEHPIFEAVMGPFLGMRFLLHQLN